MKSLCFTLLLGCCVGCSTTAGMGVGSASGSGLAIALGVGIAALAIVRGKK